MELKDEAHDLLNEGTSVFMHILRESDHDIQKTFDEFAGPDEFQFNKTVIPVRLAQYGDEKLISRSQAKRLLTRTEKFQHVVLDFDEVKTIGPAFADEIFRVYALNHPEINLNPISMEPNVEKMVNKAVALLKAR